MDRIWVPLNRPELGPLNSISNVIHREEWLNPGVLASVRRGPALVVASDYGGLQKGSEYETLSFVVADLAYLWLWDEFRTRLRSEIFRDKRKLSFKKLGDQLRSKALIPFLRASNTIPGQVITFVLNKRILALFSEPYPDPRSSALKLRIWNEKSFARLTRVAFLGGTLISCLSAPMQNVLWITDQDDIVANVQRLKEATSVVAHFLGHLCPHQLGHIRFGSTECDNGSLQVEDLASISDLTAGALAELLRSLKAEYSPKLSTITVRMPSALSAKSKMIVNWLAETSHPFKRLIIVADPVGDREYSIKNFRLQAESDMPWFDWRSDVHESLKDKLLARL